MLLPGGKLTSNQPTATSWWIQPVRLLQLYQTPWPVTHYCWRTSFVKPNNWPVGHQNHPWDFETLAGVRRLTPHCRWRGSASVVNDTNVRGSGYSPLFIWASRQLWWTLTSAFSMAAPTAFSTAVSLKQEAPGSGGGRTRWIRDPWTPRLSKVSTVV